MQSSSHSQDRHLDTSHDAARTSIPAWFEAALKQTPQRGFFQSQGAAIELLTWGETGKPGLLFVPGNGAHADWWSHIAPFFAADWRCAALSWSGMGRSERRPEGYTMPVLAQEARDAIDAARLLDAPAAPIVIGHSLGGMVAITAAAQDRRVRGLIVIDTPINLEPSRLRDVRAQAPKPRAVHHAYASRQEALARFRLSPAQEPRNPFIIDHIARHSVIEHEGTWSWHFDPRRITFDPDDADENVRQARALRCPVAYVYGERSALLTPDALARTLDSLPPGTPAIAIPDAAHHVLVDQPLALIAVLRALLSRWPT